MKDLETLLRELHDEYQYFVTCRIGVAAGGVTVEIAGQTFVVKGDKATPMPQNESQR